MRCEGARQARGHCKGKARKRANGTGTGTGTGTDLEAKLKDIESRIDSYPESDWGVGHVTGQESVVGEIREWLKLSQ